MPRPRHARRQAQAFSVSPWIPQQPTPHVDSPWYEVVAVPQLLVQQQQPPPPQQQQQQGGAEDPNVQQQQTQGGDALPGAVQAGVKRQSVAPDVGWVAARRCLPQQQPIDGAAMPGSNHHPQTVPQHGSSAYPVLLAADSTIGSPTPAAAATDRPFASSSTTSTQPTSSSPATSGSISSSHDDEGAPEFSHLTSISGTAQLLLLPNGNVTGHLLHPGTRHCWGLQGHQVLSQSNCYRDTDWSLLKMTVIKYAAAPAAAASQQQQQQQQPLPQAGSLSAQQHGTSPSSSHAADAAATSSVQDAADVATPAPDSSWLTVADAPTSTGLAAQSMGPSPTSSQAAAPQQAVDAPEVLSGDTQIETWVERTGGDLFWLRPPDMEDEETAAVILEDNLGLEPCCQKMEFAGQQLVVGPRAKSLLAKCYPRLVGHWEEVVVNVGPMTIQQLPASFLQ